MSNDKTTLADVQPGGRVRLQQALPPEGYAGAWIRSAYGQPSSFTYWNMEVAYAAGWQAALSAQPSPDGQDVLAALVEAGEDMRAASEECDNGEGLAHVVPFHQWNEFLSKLDDAEQALAARQPVGEPVEHACTNCDRMHEEVICPACAGIAWDNGRLHEFHEIRELCTSLGEGPLDHLLPNEWHEKPLLRFQGAYDEGDRSVGIGERSGNVLAADQSGTVLGDYLAARVAKEGGQ